VEQERSRSLKNVTPLTSGVFTKLYPLLRVDQMKKSLWLFVLEMHLVKVEGCTADEVCAGLSVGHPTMKILKIKHHTGLPFSNS